MGVAIYKDSAAFRAVSPRKPEIWSIELHRGLTEGARIDGENGNGGAFQEDTEGARLVDEESEAKMASKEGVLGRGEENKPSVPVDTEAMGVFIMERKLRRMRGMAR